MNTTNNLPVSTNDATKETYFDLHVTGLGYLNRVRLVKPTKGPSYLACTVAAIRGKAGEVNYTTFDVRVTGSAALKVVGDLKQAVEEKKTVMVGFKVGDIFPETFTFKSGAKEGQPGVTIKGRLLKITWARVDGQLAYTEPKESEAAPAEEEQSSQATGTDGK